MITKKFVNGKELVTSCTIANCCLTFEKLNSGNVKLTNEKGQELICTLDELREISEYLANNTPSEYNF
jgi:dissimilatory sulfite reductase (desulfoviridin) alpha/beta subunit